MGVPTSYHFNVKTTTTKHQINEKPTSRVEGWVLACSVMIAISRRIITIKKEKDSRLRDAIALTQTTNRSKFEADDSRAIVMEERQSVPKRGKERERQARRLLPSQSKMKVSTELMSSSASWRGWAEARALRASILDLDLGPPLEQKLLLHTTLANLDDGGEGEEDGGEDGGTRAAAENLAGTTENNRCDCALLQLTTPLLNISLPLFF